MPTPHTLPLVRLDPAQHGATVGVQQPDHSVLPIRHVIGVGRNYAAHAHEQGAAVPERPLLFTKNPAACCLDGDDIVIPPICQDREQVDYEGELAVVLGRVARDVQPERALAADGPVLGYAVANDVSARWWQKHGAGGQFNRGKSFDTFCPLGPAVVPVEAIADPHALTLSTFLNGERVQHASTADMIFPLATLVAEISRATTLLPGTLILTGTPAGVGMSADPQRFLSHGDAVRIEIEGVGTLRNTVRLAR